MNLEEPKMPQSLSQSIREVLQIAGQPLSGKQIRLGIFNVYNQDITPQKLRGAIYHLTQIGDVIKLKKGLHEIKDKYRTRNIPMKLDELLNEDNAPEHLKTPDPTRHSKGRVLEVLKVANQPLNTRQIRLGILNLFGVEEAYSNVSQALRRSLKQGKIKRTEYGYYQIA